ncbi:MAG: DinB family protein [Patescibacteria group bacterium]|nr:DinB family protein [Patescibacteria group bacterium]
MDYVEMLLPEFDLEMANTRRLLERIPDDKLAWKPHAKSNSIGWNANHLAEIPGWVAGIVEQDSWDFSPVDGPHYQTPELGSVAEILAMFDGNVREARLAIKGIREETLGDNWSLLQGGLPLITMPRHLVVRLFVISHLIHHRAHLCVYLRLNDCLVPGMYGPSADEYECAKGG